MGISAKEVKELRELTGVGMMECKRALEEAGGDRDRALAILRRRGAARAEKKAQREAREGAIGCYVHHNGRLAAMVELNCETDFVARSEDFQELLRDLCQQVAARAPLAVDREQLDPAVVEAEKQRLTEEARAEGKPEQIISRIVEGRLQKFFEEHCLLDQRFIKDEDRTVRDRLQEAVQKLGENLVVRRFVRYELGE